MASALLLDQRCLRESAPHLEDKKLVGSYLGPSRPSGPVKEAAALSMPHKPLGSRRQAGQQSSLLRTMTAGGTARCVLLPAGCTREEWMSSVDPRCKNAHTGVKMLLLYIKIHSELRVP